MQQLQQQVVDSMAAAALLHRGKQAAADQLHQVQKPYTDPVIRSLRCAHASGSYALLLSAAVCWQFFLAKVCRGVFHLNGKKFTKQANRT